MMQVLDTQMEIWHGQIGKIESGGDDIVCQTLGMQVISALNVEIVLFKRFIDSDAM